MESNQQISREIFFIRVSLNLSSWSFCRDFVRLCKRKFQIDRHQPFKTNVVETLRQNNHNTLDYLNEWVLKALRMLIDQSYDVRGRISFLQGKLIEDNDCLIDTCEKSSFFLIMRTLMLRLRLSLFDQHRENVFMKRNSCVWPIVFIVNELIE